MTTAIVPVIADLDQKVSQAFGLVHEAASDTATVRAVSECRAGGRNLVPGKEVPRQPGKIGTL